MYTFEQWIKKNRNLEMPKGNVPAEWFAEHDLPMVVRCTCCEMTMAAPNAFLDEEGYTYCSDCSGNGGD